MNRDDAWAGLLDADEKIIWQGQPDSGIKPTLSMIGNAGVGLFFAFMGLRGLIQSYSDSGPHGNSLLIFSGFGLIFAGYHVFAPGFLRRYTWYMLTDRRAFIAENVPFCGLTTNSYPITSETVIELEEGTPPSVIFASENKSFARMFFIDRGPSNSEIGFEYIADARHVLKLMRDIQKGGA